MKKVTEIFQICNLLYAILLLLLTFYNYHKLVYENYCIDTRPGNIVSDFVYFDVGVLMTLWSSIGYWEPRNGDETNIALYRYKEKDFLAGSSAALSFAKGSSNDTLSMSKCLFYFDPDGSSHLNLFYKAQDKFFNLTCSNRGNNSTEAKYLTFTQNGLIVDGGIQKMDGNNPVFSCRMTAFENNCSMKKTVGELYLLLTIFIIVLFFSLYLFIILFDPFKEFFHVVFKILGKEISITNYCNPLNNSFGKIKVGEYLYVFSKSDNLEGDTINQFSSSTVKMLLKSESIIIKTLGGDVKESAKLNGDQMHNLGKFLLVLFEKDENWVCNGVDHYLSVVDFIEGLNAGLFISRITSEKHLKLKSSACIKMLSSIKKWSGDTVQILAEHNKKFFGECRDDVLIAVHEHKTKWYERPFGVGNSQWKRYCSDVSNILLKNGDDYIKTQYKNPICLTQTARNVLKEFKPETGLEKEDEMIIIPPVFKNKDLDDLSRSALTPILDNGYNMVREKSDLKKAREFAQGRENLTKFINKRKDLDVKILGEEIMEVLEETKQKLSNVPNVKDYKQALLNDAEKYKKSKKSVKYEMQKREDFPLILEMIKNPKREVFLKESIDALVSYRECLTFSRCVAEHINVEQTVQDFKQQIKAEVKKQDEIQIKSEDVFKMVLLKNKKTKVFRPDKSKEKIIEKRLELLNNCLEDQNYYKCLNNVQNMSQYRKYCYNKNKMPKGHKKDKQDADWVCTGIKKAATKSRNIDLDFNQAFEIFRGEKEWKDVNKLSDKKKKSEKIDDSESDKDMVKHKNKSHSSFPLFVNKFNTQHILDFGKGIQMYKYIKEKIEKTKVEIKLKELIDFRKTSIRGGLSKYLYLGVDIAFSDAFSQKLKPFESFLSNFN